MNGIIGKYHVSKNLFDATWESGSIGNSGGNLNDTNAIRTVGFIACEAEKLYSFSPELDVTETWVNYYDNNGGISRFKITDGTFTTPQGCTRLRFRLSRTDIGVTPVPQPLPMLNVGTPLPYEPYDTEVWHDIPYTRLETATDTITALPKTIYTDGNDIGVNLLDKSTFVVGKWISDRGVISDNADGALTTQKINVQVNETYTIKNYAAGGISISGFAIGIYDSNNNFSRRVFLLILKQALRYKVENRILL